jgi:hypothetical protein
MIHLIKYQFNEFHRTVLNLGFQLSNRNYSSGSNEQKAFLLIDLLYMSMGISICSLLFEKYKLGFVSFGIVALVIFLNRFINANTISQIKLHPVSFQKMNKLHLILYALLLSACSLFILFHFKG